MITTFLVDLITLKWLVTTCDYLDECEGKQ